MNIFISLFIALFIALSIIIIYRFFHKTPLFSFNIHDFIFLILLLSFSILFSPTSHVMIWIGYLPLFYATLDDFKTQSAYPIFPLISLCFFLILSINGYSLFISIVLFVFFFLFAKFSKEALIGEGDAYFVLPIAYSLGFQAFESVILSAVLAGIFLFCLYFKEKEKNYAFFPFLVIGAFLTLSGYYFSYLFFGSLVVFIILLIVYSFKK